MSRATSGWAFLGVLTASATFPKTGRSFITIAMIPASTYYFDRLVCNLPNHKKQSQHSI